MMRRPLAPAHGPGDLHPLHGAPSPRARPRSSRSQPAPRRIASAAVAARGSAGTAARRLGRDRRALERPAGGRARARGHLPRRHADGRDRLVEGADLRQLPALGRRGPVHRRRGAEGRLASVAYPDDRHQHASTPNAATLDSLRLRPVRRRRSAGPSLARSTPAASSSAPSSRAAPKLVCIDPTSNQPWSGSSVYFPKPTSSLKTSYLNDVRFDLRKGREGTWPIITDSSKDRRERASSWWISTTGDSMPQAAATTSRPGPSRAFCRSWRGAN